MNKEQALERIAAIEKEAAELRKMVEQPEVVKHRVSKVYTHSGGYAIDVYNFATPEQAEYARALIEKMKLYPHQFKDGDGISSFLGDLGTSTRGEWNRDEFDIAQWHMGQVEPR